MCVDRQIPSPTVPRAATRREIGLGIERIGRRQKQLIRLEQFAALGLTASGVRRRVSSRDLFRVHRGVFATHPPPYSPHQVNLAAVYAGGPGSVTSDLSAAYLLGATENAPAVTHVSNRSGNGRSIDGIVVHRRLIDPADVRERFGIPCTTPARTILDCAAAVGIERLEELLMAADSGRPGLDRYRLEQLVAEHAGRRGIRNLRELISDDPLETEVENGRRMRGSAVASASPIREPSTGSAPAAIRIAPTSAGPSSG